MVRGPSGSPRGLIAIEQVEIIYEPIRFRFRVHLSRLQKPKDTIDELAGNCRVDCFTADEDLSILVHRLFPSLLSFLSKD